MLWISIFLPELSLQSHCRGALSHLTDMPLVLSDGVANRPHVHAANARAREAGITPMMPVVAAQARTAAVIVVPRDPAKEEAALTQIALWLTQFTPMTCREPAGASLEVSTTLRLFGGIAAIANRIRTGITSLGFHAAIGIAPTPLGAYLLAQASHYMAGVRMCRESAHLEERLRDIPLALFGWPHEVVQPLASLGLTRIRDLLAQPRAGLKRRFGDAMLQDIDRALGRAPDPRQPLLPPETFRSHMDLLFEIIDAERLTIPICMLVNELQGFLRARGAAVAEIELTLHHSRSQSTPHRFAARQPIRSADDWMRLIRERLTAAPLPEAVTALTLAADKLVAYEAQSESWLPTPDKRNEQWQTLLARITSRLGPKSVFSVAVREDHRPERAWQEGAAKRSPATTGLSDEKPRPLLLLTEPKPLVTMSGAPQHHGNLELLAGPERIEAGWWDGHLVARDYFVARNPAQEVCWIFCDYRQEKRWYLQGYFS
jgi:protein ImuB